MPSVGKLAKNDGCEVTVVVCASVEGRLLQHTIRSIERARAYAKAAGLSTELVLVLDEPSLATEQYVKEFLPLVCTDSNLLNVSHGSLSRSRQYAISKAKGKYITIVNAGDVISENWLLAATSFLQSEKNAVVAHPEYVFTFDGKDRIWKVEIPAEFNPAALIEQDCFGSLAMASKEVFKQKKSNDLDAYKNNAKFLSWEWNSETLSSGVTHAVVPETVLAERYEQASVTQPVIVSKLPIFSVVNTPTASLSDEPEVVELTSRLDKVRANSRWFVDRMHRSAPSRYIRNRSGRLDQYMTSLRNETLHLLRPTEVKQSLMMPDWLSAELLHLHDIDHRIYLSEHLKTVIEQYSPSAGVFTEQYVNLAARIGGQVDYLFVMPFIKNGGAEREVAFLMNAVLKKHPKAIIKILTTDTSGSPWSSNVDKRVEIIEPEDQFHGLSLQDQARLLANLCIQLSPKRVHIVNSMSAYIMLEQYSSLIAVNTRIYITIFSIDRTPEGRRTHMFTERMNSAVDDVSRIITDNQTVVDQLGSLMAIAPDKFFVLYQPIADKAKASVERFGRRPLRVLWAGRMDRQKRPDILVRIAEQAQQQGLNVEFDVYGSSAFGDSTYLDMVSNCPALNYKGGYEGGLKSLPSEQYDVFLLTSEWEGLPNVVLEAMIQGLVVLAANAGGTAELVKQNETGYLVEDFADEKQYIQALKQILNNPKEAQALAKGALKLIEKRHTQAAYEQRLSELKDYL
jgi:glycosyltransferase involved in cell wall biosynthesis